MLFHVCAEMRTWHLCGSLKWSYLSQHSCLMTGGMEGSRGGGPERGTQRYSWVGDTQPAAPVSAELQEQVDVWILNIEKIQRGSISTPVATALKGEDGDGLITNPIPQTWQMENSKELLNWVLSELTDNYSLRYSLISRDDPNTRYVFILLLNVFKF